MKKMVLSLCVLALFTVSCVSFGPPRQMIPIVNPSFELPAQEGTGVASEGWTSGLSVAKDWGRFRWPSGVKDGDWAAWSSYNGGPENGYSQELARQFEEGTYTLTVWASGDNDIGVTSRVILGYRAADGTYLEVGHNDRTAGAKTWVSQTVTVAIGADSKALGMPIWIRLTNAGRATGSGGQGNWWDNVSLSFTPAAPRG